MTSAGSADGAKRFQPVPLRRLGVAGKLSGGKVVALGFARTKGKKT